MLKSADICCWSSMPIIDNISVFFFNKGSLIVLIIMLLGLITKAAFFVFKLLLLNISLILSTTEITSTIFPFFTSCSIFTDIHLKIDKVSLFLSASIIFILHLSNSKDKTLAMIIPYSLMFNFSFNADCKTFEKLIFLFTAILFNHSGIVRVFLTDFSKCFLAYSSASTVIIFTKASS